MDMKLPEFHSQLSDEQVVNFERYLGLLLKWNRAYNLTAITDPVEVYEKHFADSATPLPFIPPKARMVDIGTGAGFPGVPIKILRDDVDVTLIDSRQKKVNFCEHVVRELGLKGIHVVCRRAEGVLSPGKTKKFDVVISRATMKLASFSRLGAKYLKQGGRVIAMLGGNWSDELDASAPGIKRAGLKLIKVYEYVLPMSQNRRAILVFEKK